MSTLQVELGERSYPITIESGALSNPGLFAPFIKSQKVVVLTNPVVQPLYESQLLKSLESYDVRVVVIPDGEQHKSFASFEQVNTELLEMNAARDTTIVALGGGVIGDLAGFVAACYQRGVPFIQVPTTLLSQVDSSVGGKTAINHPLGKNMVGAFYQPQAVVIDTESLGTLPAREFAAGMAEVIKYGIIYDAEFFAWIESNVADLKALETTTLQYAIHRCCAIKAEIVAQDEQERGLRALLNLGHTFGHAIEAEQGYGKWLHGEAVSAGTILACEVAERKNWMTSSELRRVTDLLLAFELPVAKPDDMGYDEFMKHMKRDKKVAAGAIRFIIPKGIGSAVVTSEVSETLLRDIL